MTDPARRQRNAGRLAECHPAFRKRLAALIAQLESEGHRPRIQDAWRDPIAQEHAYHAGNSDLLWGFHNATSETGEKEALAADVLDDMSPLSPRDLYLHRLNELAPRYGLMTGILWSGRRGHRLSVEEKARITNAVHTGDWTTVERIGYDPLHVQVADVSVADAKAGVRPV